MSTAVVLRLCCSLESAAQLLRSSEDWVVLCTQQTRISKAGAKALVFPGGKVVKNPCANAEDSRDTSSNPGSLISSGVGHVTLSSILAWKIP